MMFATELEREDFRDELLSLREKLDELSLCFVDATKPKGQRMWKRSSMNRAVLEAMAFALNIIAALEQQAARGAVVERPRHPRATEGPVPS